MFRRIHEDPRGVGGDGPGNTVRNSALGRGGRKKWGNKVQGVLVTFSGGAAKLAGTKHLKMSIL